MESIFNWRDSGSYAVWSPFDAFEAADALYAELKKEEVYSD
jgi:hypothetical protein